MRPRKSSHLSPNRLSMPVVERSLRSLFIGITIVVLGAVLTGCAEGPTEADLKKALQAEMDRANELAQTMLGSEAGAEVATTIHALEKLNCEPGEVDGRQEYRCKVEMDITYPPAKRQQRKASIRMVQEDNGWTVVKSF
ncbi:hypothetical protein MNBD_GAMMA26-1306 [hydrothermal vent metagenome]|uniref:Uncharacterized protein n=1 Tax=hydrothermal vent metagenome TaxID=652676 RepID=A0A3B1BUV2_9ZZZZ